MTTAMETEGFLQTFETLLATDQQGESFSQSFDGNDIFTSLEERHGELCEVLLDQLLLDQLQDQQRRVSGSGRSLESTPDTAAMETPSPSSGSLQSTPTSNVSNFRSSTTSIRSLFKDAKVVDLVPLLADLLTHRLETHALMPATQDVQANEEVLSEHTPSALSLTLPAMQAARLYAHLLSRPGALGSGLVDMEPLAALTALVRRWTVECCGREPNLSKTTTRAAKQPGMLQKSINGKKTSTILSSQDERESPTKSPPLKRTRRTTRGTDKENMDEEEEDYNGDVESQGFVATVQDPQARILQMGSMVALEVCKIPQQAEFSSWSSTAREAVIEAVVAALGASAALAGGRKDPIGSLKAVLHHGEEALKVCLAQSKDGVSSSQKHETTVIILRGLLHLLQLNVIVPFGEKGKMEARDAASHILTSLMKSDGPSSKASSRETETPSRGRSSRRSSIGKTPGTARSKSRRRASFDAGKTPIFSPALKRKGDGGGRLSLTGAGVMTPAMRAHERPHGVPAVFLGFVQRLVAVKGLERANLRKPTVETVCACIQWMAYSERSHFLRYALKLCHSKISAHRLVGCEIIGAILSEADWLEQHETDYIEADNYLGLLSSPPSASSQFTPSSSSNQTPGAIASETSSDSKEKESISLTKALWKVLKGRLVDRIAAVRASAAASLKVAVGHKARGLRAISFVRTDEEVGNGLLEMLRNRTVLDEAATVRKNSVEALTNILLLLPPDSITEGHVAAICELCYDTSLVTRKAAAESLTRLLEACSVNINDDVGHTSSDLLEEAWVAYVLPMVLDDETRDKAAEFFQQVVVKPLLEKDIRTNKTKVAFRLVASVGNIESHKGASKGPKQAMQIAFSHLGRNDALLIYVNLLERSAEVAAQSLQNADVSEATVVGSWSLLESLLSSQKDPSPLIETLASTDDGLGFCASSWQTLLQRQSVFPTSWIKSTLRSSLVVLAKIAPGLELIEAENCGMAIRQALKEFSIPPDAMTAAVDALTALTVASDGFNARKNCTSWIRQILACCETEISTFVQGASERDNDIGFSPQQESLTRALFMVGQVSMIGFRAEDDGDASNSQKQDPSKDSLQGFHLRPSKGLYELVKIMVSNHLPGASHLKNPDFARAHAFLVLGKLCLRDESLARDSLTLFARELHPSTANPNPSVQSNALLVLGDLCVRYTNMTDRYLPVMASCLQTGSLTSDTVSLLNPSSSSLAIVRKHAVLLLSSLLLKDYIKFRGLLFHRLLVATSDEDEEVAFLAESVLSGPLFVRNPKLFFNNFVESIFVLNKCSAHPIYISAARQGDGGSGIAVGFEGINLDGQAGEERRHRMYDYLLHKLSDEEKIGVTARLAKEVLAGAVDEEGDLSKVCRATTPSDLGPRLASAWNVMMDTFYVLTNKALKVSKVQEEADGMEDPNVPNPNRHVTVARSRLLSRISRKHLIEIVLPILCNLKTKLQTSRSPLLKDLMSYLLQIFKYYKVEVKEFLANDPTLLQEIEYDFRQHALASQEEL